MKINENTEIKLDLKTVISVIVITASFVGMYFTLQSDIEKAKQLPPSEIQRLEYDLKEEWNEQHITHLEERVELLESCCHILKEEVKITSAVLKDGTELEQQFEALNKQLEFLQNQKPTVIVKEVSVKKKKK